MASKVNGVPTKVNGVAPKRPGNSGKPGLKKPAAKATQRATPTVNKAASVAGDNMPGVTSAYAIMANRIANRVAEMAESITFVER